MSILFSNACVIESVRASHHALIGRLSNEIRRIVQARDDVDLFSLVVLAEETVQARLANRPLIRISMNVMHKDLTAVTCRDVTALALADLFQSKQLKMTMYQFRVGLAVAASYLPSNKKLFFASAGPQAMVAAAAENDQFDNWLVPFRVEALQPEEEWQVQNFGIKVQPFVAGQSERVISVFG